MIYFGLAMALVALFVLIFARYGNNPPPDINQLSLSEIYPDLTEDDWRWLRDTGGYAGFRIYPIKDARR